MNARNGIGIIKSSRRKRIISIVDECGELTLHELAHRIGGVSSITIRRDISELASQGLLRRRHGRVLRLAQATPNGSDRENSLLHDQLEDVDGLILPPIEGREADTLRSMAWRRRIPFLAESCPQEGGIYIGPENFSVGRELGNGAGRALSGKIRSAHLLLVSLERLSNTRSRCDGFIKGFTETFTGAIKSQRVDGKGTFKIAFSACRDTYAVHPEINVAFGVNDHSVLAAMESAEHSAVGALNVFGIGGEGEAVFDALREGRKLKACAALFPEVVGSPPLRFSAST